MITLCLEDVQQILERSSDYNPHELPKIKQKIKGISTRYSDSMVSSLYKGKHNLNNQLDQIRHDNPELKDVIDNSRMQVNVAAEDISKKLQSKIKKKVKKAPKKSKANLKEAINLINLDFDFLTETNIYNIVEAELEEGFIDIMPNMYKAMRDARKNKDGEALKVLDYLKIVLIAIIGITLLIIINTFVISLFSAIFGPVIGLALGAITSAPIFEELYKVASLKLIGNNIPAAIFSYTEFLMYMSTVLKVAAKATSPLSMFISVALGLILRIWAADNHMITARLYKSDYDQFGKIRWRTYLKGVGLHALWNLLASLGDIMGMVRKGLSTLFGFIGLGGLIKLTKKSSTMADERELKQALQVESCFIREYILYN